MKNVLGILFILSLSGCSLGIPDSVESKYECSQESELKRSEFFLGCVGNASNPDNNQFPATFESYSGECRTVMMEMFCTKKDKSNY
jgi:hypothetical protein